MYTKLDHDQAVTHWATDLLATATDVVTRKMFGCPAFFVGRRMFACVYEDEVGLKLPATQVQTLIAGGVAESFQPYGKPKMRQWCALLGRNLMHPTSAELLLCALSWARSGHI